MTPQGSGCTNFDATPETDQAIERLNQLAAEPLEHYADVRRLSMYQELERDFQSQCSGKEWAFRGQPDARWGLQPTLERKGRFAGANAEGYVQTSSLASFPISSLFLSIPSLPSSLFLVMCK
jgi:hypothetical protein